MPLIAAQRDRVPIAPFTSETPSSAVDTAYKAQSMVVEHRLQAGEQVIGAKLGLTSQGQAPRAGHRRAGVRPADIGHGDAIRRTAAARWAHPSTGGARDRVPDREADRGRRPRLRACWPRRGGVPRHRDRWTRGTPSPSGCPTPSPTTPAPRGSSSARGVARPDELVDLGVLGCVFRHRGGIDTAAGGAVMGHPAAAVVWLAEALAARGERLEAGAIVLSGGLTARSDCGPVQSCPPSSTVWDRGVSCYMAPRRHESGRCDPARLDGRRSRGCLR